MSVFSRLSLLGNSTYFASACRVRSTLTAIYISSSLTQKSSVVALNAVSLPLSSSARLEHRENTLITTQQVQLLDGNPIFYI